MKYNLSFLLKKLNSPILKNILLVGSIAMTVKIISFYKEMTIGSSFGLSELLDTFFIAVLIPTFIQSVFVNALKHLFIPNYIAEIKSGGEKKNFQALSFIIVIILVIVLSISTLIAVKYFLPVMFKGHSENYYNLIKMQFYIVLPCVLFWGLSSLLHGLIEVKNKFLVTSIAPVFTAISTIVCLLFFKTIFKERVLAIGLLSGSIISFFFVLFFALKFKALKLGKPILSNNSRLMIKQLPPKIISGLLSSLNSFVDQFFAAQLVIGSIAAINYGVKIPAFAVGILILALGNVLLPHFSRLTNENLDEAYKQLFKILKMLFFGMAFISIILILFSDQIIALLFERKEFTADNTLVVANIQKIALIYIPFYLCTLVTVKFLTAINKNKFMAWTSMWNLCLNLILNIIFMKYWGVYGLILSTTCVYIISSFIYIGFTYKEYQNYIASN